MTYIHFGLSKNDSLILKGLAIILISLHNLIHRLPNLPIENEFSYQTSGSEVFFSILFFRNPIEYFISFLGHYGVQIFIFLSAYAFYLRKEEILKSKKWIFFLTRFKRILIPFSIAMVIVSILNVLLRVFVFNAISPSTIINSFLGTYFGGMLHLTMLHPFLPYGTPGGLGPWWFISFILQFYLLLPLLLKININLKNTIILTLIAILGCFIISTTFPEFKLYYTVFGHFPEILLGFYSAKFLRDYKLSVILCVFFFVISFCFLLGCNFYSYLWYFAAIPAVVCFFILFKFVNFIPFKLYTNGIRFIGKISIYIFVLNGITREFFIYYIKLYPENKFVYFVSLVLYLALTIILSNILFKFQSKLPQYIKTLVNTFNR